MREADSMAAWYWWVEGGVGGVVVVDGVAVGGVRDRAKVMTFST